MQHDKNMIYIPLQSGYALIGKWMQSFSKWIGEYTMYKDQNKKLVQCTVCMIQSFCKRLSLLYPKRPTSEVGVNMQRDDSPAFLRNV